MNFRRTLAPRFANQQQADFFWSQATEVLYSGAFGAGKSRILCEKAFWLAQQHNGAKIAICRKVAASLAATTELTFVQDVLRPSGVGFKQNRTERWFEFGNGSRIWFFGLDPDPQTGVPSKIGSFDADFIFVDEAVELTEADWMMLIGRLRHDAAGWQQIGAATNPADPSHWLKARFEQSDHLYLHASTFDNRLTPESYKLRMAQMTGIYASRYAEGQWIAVEGALFSPDNFVYREPPVHPVQGRLEPDYLRVVVAIDPAVTHGPESDETGIVVVAKAADGNGYVLDDQSGRFAPLDWAKRAIAAYLEHGANTIVGEVNNGGELVEANLRAAGYHGAFNSVSASRGKRMRADPIQILYAEKRIFHVRRFPVLESQMVAFNPESNVSPDRLDALVWGFTDLFPPVQVITGDFALSG
jgi:phage terminase large subunit-like protein